MMGPPKRRAAKNSPKMEERLMGTKSNVFYRPGVTAVHNIDADIRTKIQTIFAVDCERIKIRE